MFHGTRGLVEDLLPVGSGTFKTVRYYRTNGLENMYALSCALILSPLRSSDSFGAVVGFNGLTSSLPSSFFALAASANDAVLPPANAPKPADDPPNAEKAPPELGGVLVGVVGAPNEGEPM